MRLKLGFSILALLVSVTTASAQVQIPPPTNPVAVCFTQAAPAADSHQLVFDAGAPENVTTITPTSPDSPTKVFCAANGGAWTHAISIPAARFTLGNHTIQIRAVNAFGGTLGNVFAANVGIAPGPPSITALGQVANAEILTSLMGSAGN